MPTSPTEIVFTLTIDQQDIRVRYRPDHIDGSEPYAILEFMSAHDPRQPIPVSDSGYCSFFAPTREIEAAPSVERYASMVALLLGRDLALRVSKRHLP